MKVGIKALRDKLSRYIECAREGNEITVTDHGKPVARIVPVGRTSRLEQLIAEGLVQKPRNPERTIPDPIEPAMPGATVSDLVGEQRQ